MGSSVRRVESFNPAGNCRFWRGVEPLRSRLAEGHPQGVVFDIGGGRRTLGGRCRLGSGLGHGFLRRGFRDRRVRVWRAPQPPRSAPATAPRSWPPCLAVAIFKLAGTRNIAAACRRHARNAARVPAALGFPRPDEKGYKRHYAEALWATVIFDLIGDAAGGPAPPQNGVPSAGDMGPGPAQDPVALPGSW